MNRTKNEPERPCRIVGEQLSEHQQVCQQWESAERGNGTENRKSTRIDGGTYLGGMIMADIAELSVIMEEAMWAIGGYYE